MHGPNLKDLFKISRTPFTPQDRYLNTRRSEFTPGFDLTADKSLAPFEVSTNPQSSKFSLNLPPAPASLARKLPSQAERILDAPEIIDDYYLNLLDWGDNNILAVALSNKLYMWNANNCTVSQLLEYNPELITSVSWKQGSRYIAVGDSSHTLKLFDLERGSEVRSMACHSDRVSSLAWNNHVLSSGSRDSSIIQHDIRIKDYFVKYTGHEQEVCGLKWNAEGTQLASGGNDNKLCVWETRSTVPQRSVTAHSAAVKALAWCPWKTNCLATGGGTADRQIKIWDTANLDCRQAVDTGSQVCALEWNCHEQEIVSAHGYSQNQLILWKAPGLNKVSELLGHTARVLCMAQNPAGSTVVTASADETLRFWNIFESSVDRNKENVKDSPDRLIGFRYR